MEKKKPTNAQLQKRLNNAIIHIDKTKYYRSKYFNDKGIMIELDEDVAIISRSSFKLCFNRIVGGGYGRMYILLSNVLDCADIYDKDSIVTYSDGSKGRSFNKMMNSVRGGEKKDGSTTNLIGTLTIFDVWFDALQMIMFLSPEKPDEMYALNNIYATSTILFGVLSKPYDKDMTNNELNKLFLKDMEEYFSQLERGGNELIVLSHESEDEKKTKEAQAQEEFEKEESFNNLT